MARRILQATFALLLSVAMLPAMAAVVASIDRAEVELNESFTLKVTVDTAIDVEPNVDALEADFYIGTRSHMSNTTIVNGQISRSRTWTYVLMAKQEGDLVIPPITVAAESSDPLEIMVKPVTSDAPGEAEIFITAEADHSDSYVQAQILYTLKVYRAVSTRQPRLSEPEVSGVDVLVEVAGDERSYDAILNGKAYNVVERVYALFPQASGELNVAPVRFEARVLRDGRITGRKVFRSEPVTINVRPIPPPPASHPDAVWLPARSVELSEDWSREPGDLPAGEPITRHITVTALGQLSTQIPVIEPESTDELKIYPDKPELSVVAVPRGILATRSEQYAMIGVHAGPIELPAVELPWWDIAASEWKVASLPPRTLQIKPSADALPPQPAAVTDVPSAEAETVYIDDPFWQRISEGLAIAWLLTLCAWWWSRRGPREEASNEPPVMPLHKQQSRFLKAARKAATDGDSAGVQAALLEWARLEWPENTPRSIGAIAERLNSPLSDELRAMAASRYGRDAGSWDKAALVKALRNVTVRKEALEQREDDGLPPLMPAGQQAR